jgi:DNA-binding response OmpR family regulator
LLARHLSRAVEREELLRSVWGLDPRGLDTRTVDMAVVRLREKLGPSGADIVRTVRGKGYVLGDGARVER